MNKSLRKVASSESFREIKENFKNIKTNAKGITLIALVVSIIVILIISGIAIGAIAGNNGLLINVTTAKQETEEATELELIKLAITAAQTAGEGKLTEDNLNNELRANFNDNDIDINLKSISDYWNYKGYKIDNKGNVEELLLPKEYQQVEYIESTGTQYIDTKIIPKVDLNGEFLIEPIKFGYPFGSTNGQNIDYWGINFYSNGQLTCYFGTGSYPIKHNWEKNKKYNIIIENKKFYCDKNMIYDFNDSNNTYNFKTTQPIYLFALNYQGVSYSSFKFYKATFWGNQSIIRDFIPCSSTTTVTDVNGKQCPTGTIGMYDTVEGKFYTNQGTGEFLKGNDV